MALYVNNSFHPCPCKDSLIISYIYYICKDIIIFCNILYLSRRFCVYSLVVMEKNNITKRKYLHRFDIMHKLIAEYDVICHYQWQLTHMKGGIS